VNRSADGAALVPAGASWPLPQPAVIAMTAPAAKAKTRLLMYMLEGLLIASHRGKRFISGFIAQTTLFQIQVSRRSRVTLTGVAAEGLIDISAMGIDGSDDAARMRVEFPGAIHDVMDRGVRRDLGIGWLALSLPSDRTIRT